LLLLLLLLLHFPFCKQLFLEISLTLTLSNNRTVMCVTHNINKFYIQSVDLIWIILDRHTSYNIKDLKVPSSVTNKIHILTKFIILTYIVLYLICINRPRSYMYII
jgi:hypothetical protein